ncbi:DeoR/GlpR transcriptional regulator [Neobacillus notoginsengisoli]|uniref:DeoR/GlpR transcriptional regulator n=1 Tax=Neobacillus notoginsengisoli TaxID=1578198 RepID=A0A417YIJ1_9BACI|nr:DeoR/GlpR family DNA-binding transcription regulator [Neobacillus notoginsengisoli]RHW32839.1 DeoR/GlpR transcriptional regulator [Neobacillus notoginsengisoli]
MLKQERINEILKLLHQNGKVEVNNLVRLFNVTEMTIRRDLNDLFKQNLAVRSYGGATLPPDRILTEKPFELRINKNQREKDAIAELAIPLIEDGMKVFLDSSTTCYSLARKITNDRNFIIITDTISTAMELNTRNNIQVVCLGGELRKNTHSCVGMFAEQMVNSMHFDISFISVPNITVNGTLSSSSIMEASLKRTVIENSSLKVLLVDSSKVGGSDFIKIGDISIVDIVITDSNMSLDFINHCKNKGIEVKIAEI